MKTVIEKLIHRSGNRLKVAQISIDTEAVTRLNITRFTTNGISSWKRDCRATSFTFVTEPPDYRTIQRFLVFVSERRK